MENGNEKRIHHYNERIQWVVLIGFLIVHLACFAAFYTGVTKRALVIGVVLYWVRMFGVTAGLHRYFAHHAYQTSRWFQFVLALLGAAAFHGGPLSWVSRHRWHHRYSDQPEDFHSPVVYGFWQSHFGWLLDSKNIGFGEKGSKDFNKFPELRLLERWHWLVPLTLAVLCYLFAGPSGLVVGMGWSTVLMFHFSVSINSLSHVWGSKRYLTLDESRNNAFLAFFTMGEGWHNNHHHLANVARQGFYWWEIDFSYYILRLLVKFGLVHNLREPTREAIEANHLKDLVIGKLD